MPPQAKLATPSKPTGYVMPKPTQVVMWRHAVGAEPAPAVVTKVGRQGISVMIFPPDSRVGVPKDGCRHIGDPAVKTQVQPEAGVWDYTDEFKLLLTLVRAAFPDLEGHVQPLPKDAPGLLAPYLTK